MFEYFNTASPEMLLMGLFTGLVFGFLLQRGGVTRYRVILGQFLWKDHTVLKVMLTAVAVGAVGIWSLYGLYGISLHLKASVLGANLVGGVIFGVGMALLGYCPGTGVGAIGDGSRHAFAGILGMFTGAALYPEVYPLIAGNLLQWSDLGKITWTNLLGLPMPVMVGILVVGIGALLYALPGSPKQTEAT